jgi:hypothetical protein
MVFSPGRVRHPDRYGSSDQTEFHVSPDLAAIEPELDRHFGRGRRPSHRTSIGRQVFRAVFYSLLIGAITGLPLAWQLGDKNTKEMIAAWAIPVGQWLSVSTTKSPPAAAEAVSKIPDRAAAFDAFGSPQPARNAQAAPAPAPASAPAPVPPGSAQELQRQLETIAGDLAAVRRLAEQLAARQNQMAQDLATLQAAERDVSQKLSAASQPPARPPPPHRNAPKPLPLAAPPQSSSAPLPAARPQEPLPPPPSQ